MRSVIGEVEVAEYMYPKLMTDEDGYIYFMIDESEGVLIHDGRRDYLPTSFQYAKDHGPLKDFHGSITLSNS